MPGYLILWNPKKWEWSDWKKCLADVTRQGLSEERWSCGVRRNLPVGSRLFLMRKATPLRGIVASGWSTGLPEMDAHWGKGDSALYVPLEFDAMVEPYGDSLLPVEVLQMGATAQVNWDTQGGGIEIPDVALERLETLWTEHLASYGLRLPRLAPKQRSLHWVRRRERDSAFSKQIRSLAKGCCAVCPPGFKYTGLGILETAHIRAVEHDGPDEIGNALALCPTHHALFDEGLWTIGAGGAVRFSQHLPEAFRKGFSAKVLRVSELTPKYLKWHRDEVFRP
jgi:hypothetical protein